MNDDNEITKLLEEVAFQLIGHAGEARSYVYDALTMTVAGNHIKAREYLQQASDELVLAHKAQLDLLKREASGQPVTPTILLVHAQDILMASLSEKALAEKIIDLYNSLKSMIPNKMENKKTSLHK